MSTVVLLSVNILLLKLLHMTDSDVSDDFWEDLVATRKDFLARKEFLEKRKSKYHGRK